MAIIRKTYLPDPNFKPPIVAKASSAAEGLCKWIIALDMYDKVIKVVAPKKEKLEIANAEYEATMAILEGKRNEVRQLQARLDSLKERLEEAVLYKEKLLAEVALCESKLLKAERLIGWRVNYSKIIIRIVCTVNPLSTGHYQLLKCCLLFRNVRYSEGEMKFIFCVN